MSNTLTDEGRIGNSSRKSVSERLKPIADVGVGKGSRSAALEEFAFDASFCPTGQYGGSGSEFKRVATFTEQIVEGQGDGYKTGTHVVSTAAGTSSQAADTDPKTHSILSSPVETHIVVQGVDQTATSEFEEDSFIVPIAEGFSLCGSGKRAAKHCD